MIVLPSYVFGLGVDELGLKSLPFGGDDVVHLHILAALDPTPMG